MIKRLILHALPWLAALGLLAASWKEDLVHYGYLSEWAGTISRVIGLGMLFGSLVTLGVLAYAYRGSGSRPPP